MTEWILRLIEHGGYWGIAFLMFLENVIPPIPSEVIMGLGGVAVARGTMEFWPLLLIGTLGSTAGNYVWFLLAERFGYERLRPFVERWGRWMTMEWNDIERSSAFFRRHGQWIVFALRFSPLLRTVISIPAGLAHMPHRKFLAFTFAGAAIWNAALIVGGHWMADFFDQARYWLDWGLGLGMALAIGYYAWRVITWKSRD